ncbi:MAG TPA: nucleoside-diphosphate sugar epimerase/dehydratase [Burkholderiales bacterium]|nr:nucleoside-diphosphate sugar epimerase/dehydratase [Burkholderiales bacterium]
MLRILFVFLHDVGAAAAAWVLAHWLRFNMEIPPYYDEAMWRALLWIVPAQTVVFWGFGLYRGMWRYASLRDLQRLALAVIVSGLIAPLLTAAGVLTELTPRSVFLLDPLLLLFIMSGSRIAYRVWKEHDLYGALRDLGKPVFILGAGDTALTLVRELQRSPDWRVVGLLDDDPALVGRLVNGVKVHGAIDRLPELAKKANVEHAIIALPGASHQARRRVLEICTAAKVKALTVPSYDDLVSGRVSASALRNVELDDLLGRDPVQLDDAGLHELITGHTIMVTGAGGSIGSELCRQIARFEPRLLVLFEMSEFALYTIDAEFAQQRPTLPRVCVIGDVKDEARLKDVLTRYRPRVVFHAAAYKHVPLMENDNAWAALQNNVLGTYIVAKAAADADVERFVLISTDKAVNPVNVMGATKRLAEQVCQALQGRSQMALVAVRFGNVLGSAGSVIPRFREQLERGGPLTVTHPDIIRYFMSIPEAAQLVLQAGLMGRGGEVFMLEMGEPVRIVDLARDMIRLSGLSEEEVGITFTGLRPGEKLYEELVAHGEESLPTPHPKLRIVSSRHAQPAVLGELIPWLASVRPLGAAETKATLAHWVPEYAPARHELETESRPARETQTAPAGPITCHAEPPVVGP